MEKKKERIDYVIELEWEQFQQVQNEGGRASCQDDRRTFDIMRRSQFLAWEEQVLKSYQKDLLDAKAAGWNLIREKYMRMMESTAPKQFAEFAELLPAGQEDRKELLERIVRQEVQWAEEVAGRYPQVSAGGRKIHSAEDTPWETSIETYLRGELGTYSDRTLTLYADMIGRMERVGENLAELTLGYTARLYGYESLKEAEDRMRGQRQH